MHVWLVLWKASDAIRAHAARSIDELGMCLTDFGILEALLHKGPMSVNELGSKVGLTSGSATTAVDRLVDRRLVARSIGQQDRRSRMVALTSSGRSCIAPAFAEHERAMEQAVSGLSVRERGTLLGLLKRLGRHAAQGLSGAERATTAATSPQVINPSQKKNSNRSTRPGGELS